MKFSIGDQILLKRTGEEGRVVAFLSKTMMEVEVDGVRFPVYNEEVDHPYLKWFTEKKKPRPRAEADIPTEKPASRAQRLARGIYLSFLPQFVPGMMDDIIESFKIHLINETPDAISFSYDARSTSGNSLFGHKGVLHPFGHLYLHPLTLEEVNEQPRFHWEIAIAAAKHKVPVSGVLRIRPAQLIRYIQGMLEQNNTAISLMLAQDAVQTEALPTPMPALGSGAVITSDSRITLHTSPEAVLDLHMNPDSKTAHIAPDEILNAQMLMLQQKLQAALAAGLPGMIVIHGIGNGTLRQRVHELLSATKEVESFSNRWMSGYGWGATEVVFAAK
jgi:hypothetical protein